MAALAVLGTALVFSFSGQLPSIINAAIWILLAGTVVVVAALLYSRTLRKAPATARSISDAGNPGIKSSDRGPRIPVAGPEAQLADQWSIDLIRSLDWKRFEELCAAYFVAKGQKARVTNIGADGGVDVLLYASSDPDKVLGVVQCKAWNSKPVGVREVRELLGVMTDAGCPVGMYLTTSAYTPEAQEFAKSNRIKLVDAERFLELIRQLPPGSQNDLLRETTIGDFRTPSCPNCGIKLVTRTARRGGAAGGKFWGCRNFPRCRYRMRQRTT